MIYHDKISNLLLDGLDKDQIFERLKKGEKIDILLKKEIASFPEPMIYQIHYEKFKVFAKLSTINLVAFIIIISVLFLLNGKWLDALLALPLGYVAFDSWKTLKTGNSKSLMTSIAINLALLLTTFCFLAYALVTFEDLGSEGNSIFSSVHYNFVIGLFLFGTNLYLFLFGLNLKRKVYGANNR